MLIKGQQDIQIEISDVGYIMLKQQDVDGDQTISFAPAYAAKVAKAINELQEFAQQKFERHSPEEDN